MKLRDLIVIQNDIKIMYECDSVCGANGKPLRELNMW